jgi:DNA-binding transcriptional ArsR family regulator
MSSGVVSPHRLGELRALAHPVRLRILSLLTGAAMSAAEVARELDLTHANASYHLRQLHRAGYAVIAGEESIRGGKAKRYRYDVDQAAGMTSNPSESASYYQAIAAELVRRGSGRSALGHLGTSADAELWVPEDAWQETVRRVSEAVMDLHRAALPPRAADAVHVSVTTALFEMADRTAGAAQG